MLHTPPVASVAGSRPPHRAVSVFFGRSREAPACVPTSISTASISTTAPSRTPHSSGWICGISPRRSFPTTRFTVICYFTALVKPRPNDPHQTERQDAYLRALATLPGLEIHYGEFRERIKSRPLAVLTTEHLCWTSRVRAWWGPRWSACGRGRAACAGRRRGPPWPACRRR